MSTVGRIGIKEGELFVIMDPVGDISPTEVSPEQGVYKDDTRFLSRLELRIEGMLPRLLSSTVKKDNVIFSADLTNPPIYRPEGKIPRDTVHILRERFIWHDTCYERLSIKNYNQSDIRLCLSLHFGADFKDIFEMRGVSRLQRGKMLPAEVTDDTVVFGYLGRDGVKRYTDLRFNPRPQRITPESVEYELELHPNLNVEVILSITAGYERQAEVPDFQNALHLATTKAESLRATTVDIFTSNEHFNEFVERSKADICTLVTETPYGLYPFAGIPWYCTAFGRDGIITALQCLWIAPEIAKGVLRFLSVHQAEDFDDENDAEPGKIPHEIRKGEMANTREIPFARYYGSVDATPLYIVLAGEYLKRTGDLETIREIWPNIKAALRWITEYGDIDGDGFIEYHRRSSKGLINQSWKDSSDSVFYADGSLVKGPVAAVEVQGYVYLAYAHAQKLSRVLGENTLVLDIQKRMKTLKAEFQKAFWSRSLGMYILALDGEKRPCEVRASNAAHTLFTGIANKPYARKMARVLLSEEFFSGWGIRTLAKGESKYNPMSYHNGSVWPHDNALIAWGLSKYGFRREVLRILTGMFDVSQFVELRRLPELFCGFDRRAGEGPTLYPVACQPQAWASGAVFMLLQSALGLGFESETNSIIFKNPMLPEYLEVVVINNLTLMHSRVNLYLERYKDDVVVKVIDKEGDVNIVIYK